MPNKWDKDTVVLKLQEIYKNTGDLSYTSLSKTHGGLYVTARKLFNGFDNALISAGFNPSEVKRKRAKWDDEELKREIEMIYSKSGTLSEKFFRDNHSNIVSVCQTKYGGWYKALKRFGFPTDEVKIRWKDGNTEEVIFELNRLDNEGISLNITNVPNSIAVRAVRVFGSWDNALIASGIDPKSHRKYEKWSSKSMVERLKSYASEGYNLSHSSIVQIDSALASSYKMYFESWDDLIIEAGYTPYKYTSGTNKTVMGFKFQQILREIFYVIGLNFNYEKTHGNVRPDFTLNGTTWIDAKLSSWTAIVDGTLRKYCDKIDTLIIVYLRGNEIQGYNNVVFISVDDFFPILKEKERLDLIESINNLKQELTNLEESTG